MDVDNKVLQILELPLTVVVVSQQFPHQLGFGLFQRDVVGISAQNVFEFTLQLIDIVVVLPSKRKFNLFVLLDQFLLLFSPFVEILAQAVNDSIVMMPVLLPENTKLLFIGFDDIQVCVSDLEAILDEIIQILLVNIFDINGEITFSFVKPDIG